MHDSFCLQVFLVNLWPIHRNSPFSVCSTAEDQKKNTKVAHRGVQCRLSKFFFTKCKICGWKNHFEHQQFPLSEIFYQPCTTNSLATIQFVTHDYRQQFIPKGLSVQPKTNLSTWLHVEYSTNKLVAQFLIHKHHNIDTSYHFSSMLLIT